MVILEEGNLPTSTLILIPDFFDVFLIFFLVRRLYLGILFKHHYGVYIYETGILCEIVIIKP